MHIKIWTNRVQYEFDLFEKYNVLKGNSATGKTTLCETIDLIDIHACNINSPIACVNLPNRDYEILLKTVQGVLYVIDENHLVNFTHLKICIPFSLSKNLFILIK